MPTYEYECVACSHTLEIVQSFKEATKRKCPNCGKLKLRRLISGGVGLVFKGSGFYINDSKANNTTSNTNSNTTSNTSSSTSSNAKTTNTTAKSDTSKSDGGSASKNTNSSSKAEKKTTSSPTKKKK